MQTLANLRDAIGGLTAAARKAASRRAKGGSAEAG